MGLDQACSSRQKAAELLVVQTLQRMATRDPRTHASNQGSNGCTSDPLQVPPSAPIRRTTRSDAGVSCCLNDTTRSPISVPYAPRGAVFDRQPDCCRDVAAEHQPNRRRLSSTHSDVQLTVERYPLPLQDAGVALGTRRVQRAVPRYCSVCRHWRLSPAGVLCISRLLQAYMTCVAGPARELMVPHM